MVIQKCSSNVDYESPRDKDKDNVYEFQFTANTFSEISIINEGWGYNVDWNNSVRTGTVSFSSVLVVEDDINDNLGKISIAETSYMNDDGTLEGDFAKRFEQAMRIEGTFKSQGKHAAGVVISSHNLNDVCPMVRDKKGSEKIAGMEMNDLESMGHVKFDILGVSLLDKIMGVRDELNKEQDDG